MELEDRTRSQANKGTRLPQVFLRVAAQARPDDPVRNTAKVRPQVFSTRLNLAQLACEGLLPLVNAGN